MASAEKNKSQINRNFPLPYFQITEEFEIVDYSGEAEEQFEIQSSFMDLLDAGSRRKAVNVLQTRQKGETELAMVTKDGSLNTFRINFKWDGAEAGLICSPQDSHMENLLGKIEQQQKRLAETDLELLFKKEELEESLLRITELSGPVIYLSEKLVLIPLFGDLDSALLGENRSRIASSLNSSSAEKAIIDFSAVGKVTDEGAGHAADFLTECKLMGIQPYFSGLKPAHAFALHRTGSRFDIEALSSLKKAIKKLFSF
ncbi:STAS domain-containing protein [Metabacillus sp. GX 13764]|uniref:STAS domain-containing protein n=1 Tax=Metabacillus kandeliae TaxID=2900151 RepID=UPI001E30ADE0|nr:STAS domain-containing protein [Metabacillus kandeliae]MCD7036508.1 STAS domain-containing protein [Metabacillus kandeliae]